MRKMLWKTLPLMLLTALILAGCARAASFPSGGVSAGAWPTHEPGATPYVRTASAEREPVPADTKTYESVELLWSDIYEEFGRFYARKDDLELFRSLPQDEPFRFVPHSPRFVLDEGEALRMAMLFDGLEGCEARVIALKQIVDGLDDWSFLTVVSMTPARMFELSEELDATYMFEQLYPSVEERFDIAYWPEGLYEQTGALLEGLEARGSLYFAPETLERLKGLDRDAVCDFALQACTPSGWSRDANDILPVLRGREGVELKLLFQENIVPSESLCVASMTLSRMSVLSDELPGRYLVRLADEELRAAYDGAVLLRVGPDGEEVTEVTEP